MIQIWDNELYLHPTTAGELHKYWELINSKIERLLQHREASLPML